MSRWIHKRYQSTAGERWRRTFGKEESTMSAPWEPVITRRFVDHDCTLYRALFSDIRIFDYFKWHHVCRVFDMEELT
jgi:hypothetical protein